MFNRYGAQDDAEEPFDSWAEGAVLMRMLITGGTGTVGRCIVKRASERGICTSFDIFSRDEHKQQAMAGIVKDWGVTDINFIIGDIRDREAVRRLPREADYIVHAAALKHVGVCERNRREAHQINAIGSALLLESLSRNPGNCKAITIVSSDKVCHPITMYALTKSIAEKLYVEESRGVSSSAIRLCNVLGSRGSVLELFRKMDVPTVTDPAMSRFFISPFDAADFILNKVRVNGPNCKVYVPKAASSSIGELARVISEMFGSGEIDTESIGPRPWENVHEALVADWEVAYTEEAADGYIIHRDPDYSDLTAPIMSQNYIMDVNDLQELIVRSLGEIESVRF